MLTKRIIAFLFIFYSISTFAKTDVTSLMSDSKMQITNLDSVLSDTKKTTDIFIEFPSFVPKTSKTYFANLDSNSKQYGFVYMINVDSSANCGGVKSCNIGTVTARKDTTIDKLKDNKNKVITKEIMLADGLSAYFTPGRSVGDFHPANIQWLDNNILYSITWNVEAKQEKNEEAILIFMANSAKHPGSG
jgi:hypothetical protein